MVLLHSVAFERFELHPKAFLLLHDSTPVPLGGRAFDLLCVLISHRDRMVSKAELLDLVWPGLVVEENNLSVQVSTLRRLLGRAAIITVPGRGYRFSLPVRRIAANTELPANIGKEVIDVPKSARATPSATDFIEHPGEWADEADIVLAAILDGAAEVRPTPPLSAPTDSHAISDWNAGAAACIRNHSGVLLAMTKASVVAQFASARNAVACAQALQVSFTVSQASPLKLALVSRQRGGSATDANDGLMAPDMAVQSAFDLALSAAPGELRASAEVRDHLTDGLDVIVEDLGDLQLQVPGLDLRSFRLDSVKGLPEAPHPGGSALKPIIAVLPFDCRQTMGSSLAVGELIADGLIANLSHSQHPWRVISRLSTTAFRGRDSTLSEVRRHLSATFLVSGSYVEDCGRLWVTMQIVDCRSGEVEAARRMEGTTGDLLGQHSSLLDEMLSEIQRTIYDIELQRVQSSPLPTLESYTLLLGGIQLLHRSTPRDFDLSLRVLRQLAEWHPRAPEPLVWQAKWYAMRAVQGLSQDLLADAKAALACTGAALVMHPDNPLALAMEGFVHVHLTRDYSVARERLEQSIQRNHSEPFAHLFHSIVQGITGDFSAGLDSHDMAVRTSPQDPARYLFDTIGSYLNLGSGRLDAAIRLARESLRLNRNHAHSWRTLTIAQQESGAKEAARSSLQQVLKLQPDLTVTRYLAGARPDDAMRHRFALALHGAGLPLH